MKKIRKFTVGPILGATDGGSARVFGRGELEPTAAGPRGSYGAIRWRKAGKKSFSEPRFFRLNPNFDLTGTFTVQGLLPATEYEYQTGWFFSELGVEEVGKGPKLDWSEAGTTSFTTASEDAAAKRSLVFGSCRYLVRILGSYWCDDRGDKVFRSILRQIDDENERTDLLLMIGDQIYADDIFGIRSDDRLDQFNERYRAAFSPRYVRELMSRVPTYMTLDDHEIENDWPAAASEADWITKYPAAMQAFLTYQASHGPLFAANDEGYIKGRPNHYWYPFMNGCCDFFVLDTRTERWLDVSEGEEPEIMSDIQLRALLEWLADGSGKVKIVVTSVPLFPDGNRRSQDKWTGFLAQRTKVLDHIRDEKVRRVVFLGGDLHLAMSAALVSPSHPDFQVVSLVSSGLFWPLPDPRRRNYQMDGPLLAKPGRDYTVTQGSEVYRKDNFARVDVDLEGVDFRLFTRKGEPVFSRQYKFK